MTDRRDLLDSYLAPPSSPASGDPLDNALQTDRRDVAVRTFFAQRAADAERAAKANRIARQTGLPGDTVERNYSSIMADIRGRQGAEIIRGNDNLASWFGNPRNAAASADDVPALGAMSTLVGPNSLGNAALGITPLQYEMGQRAVTDLMRKPSEVPLEERFSRIRAQEQGRQEAIQAERPKNTAGSWWRGVGIGILGGFQQARIGAKAFMADALGLDTQVEAANREYQQVSDVLAATTPRDMSRFSQAVYGGAISTGLAAPALIGTVATGGAGGVAVGLGLAGSQSGLSAYGKYRARGATANEALLGGTLEGGIEAGTELLPLGALAHGFGKKALGRFAGEFLLKEMGGEQLATFGQDAVDTAIANPDATWSQFWADRPGAAFDTAVAVIMQTGVVGGGSAVARALRPVERDTEHATDAIAGANLMDSVMDTAAGSRLRERDPEAFREFMEQHTEGSPIESVYVPVETMRQLMQSDAFDPDAWDWAPDLAQQVAQASATGGDVVLPMAGVAAHLSGSTAWDTIRQDVRLSPGGMSEREANEFNARYGDLMEEQGRAAAAELRADNEARAPERKVYDAVLTQAREAGFNLRASQAYADLYASRYASRAARLGTDAWQAFQASNVSIQQELPASIAGYRKADQLDVVVNALRRDAQAPSDRKRFGASLAEFLAGSIDDVGGDLASMGANEWHKGKPGRRKFIRRSAADLRASEGQGSMLGGTASSRAGIDEALERAIEAGYFPELQGRGDIVGGVDSGTYADKPDPQILLDALDAEFRGSPRYAEVQGTRAQETQAEMAAAVDDLRRILDEAGLDPATATREEIEGAVNRYGIAPDAEADGRAFDQGERGRIDIMADGRNIIRLFEGRDLSTLLHESGHLWLEELRADATREDAPDALREDWGTVKGWFAANGATIEEGGEIPTNAHEMWARGIERYFMEGKAPTSGLSSAFQSFRAWLLRIYQVVQRLGTPLNDDVRDVMARLIATDDAISAAVQDTESQPLSQEALGMTDAEYADHMRIAGKARSDAFDALLFRTMETIRRSRTKEWKAERARVREELAEQVAKRPEFRALAILRARDDTRIALDRTAIVEDYGEDAIALIPKGVPPTVAAVGGVHPDVLAEKVGLRSGRELLDRLMGIQQRENALRATGDKRSAFNETLDAQADELMRQRNGDVLTDGSIEEEALAVIHNDTRATVIASELRALARRIAKDGNGERVATPWTMARDWAQRMVREGLIAEQATAAAVSRHQRNEAKAGREAERAILAGDTNAAFTAKQQQMLNSALFRAAKEAKDEVAAIVKRLGKLASARTLPSMDQEYLERIHDLLEAYDMKPRSARSIAERESFAAWVKAKEDAGEEVHVPPRLRDSGTTHFSKLTVDDIMALDDAVASIAHLGRAKKKLTLAKEERDFEEVVDEFVTGAEALPERKFSADRNRKTSWARRFDAIMVKMEFVADQLDGGRSDGIANRLLIQGATQAANVKARLTESVLAPLAKLYLDMPKAQQRRLSERVTVPEFVEINPETREIVPSNFSRMDLIAVALNTGNESNYDKMVRGESLPFQQMPDLQWTRPKVEAVLARELREEDWRFVESVWRQIDTLWPEIERSERAITGVVPERVEARTVTTPFGEIRGGYYPVVYDPARSRRAADNYEDDAARLMGQMGRAVSTPKGHTIERTEYAAPLKLAVEPVLLNHVRRVTTRVAYGTWVRDVLKFTENPRVRSMIERKVGPEYFAQIRPWIKSQVNDAAMDTNTLHALDQVMRQFRTNATMVGLGFRITTVLAQLGGLPNSAAEIGGKWLGQGMVETAMGMGKARGFVFERSEEMQRRAQDMDRDISMAFADLGKLPTSRVGKVVAPLKRARDATIPWAFWMIGAVDVNLISVPTWLGAYRRAISEGMTEEQAAARGDKAVRKSQGSGRSKDLAAIQMGSEGHRVLTMFFTAFSVLYNRQRDMIGDVKKGDYRKAASEAMWVMMAGPLLSALLTGDWPQDDESWLQWATRKVFFGLWLGIPGVRDVMGMVERKVSGQYAMPTTAPVYRAAEGMVKVGEDFVRATKGEEVSDRWLKHAIETPGYFVGASTGQVSSTVDYGYAVATGQQKPQGVMDVAAGVIKGRREDQE